MAFNEPVLTKRIPLDPAKRKLIGYDDYVATGGYVALKKAIDMKAEEIRIPVSEEKVNVSKETVVKEEVTVGKRRVTETKRVGGTVRKEEARVESEGDIAVSGTGTQSRIRGRSR